jgi:Rrf2 family transcriptional regulator, nitric oxide-sensitive transcriptional repressor
MHLTRFSDNALRCLIVLGLEPDRAVPVPEIAARMNMSYEHLVKIVQRLATLGYVETVRGRSGGARLAIEPAALSLGTLVRQTEENLDLVECFTSPNSPCPIAPACRLSPILDQALAAFFAVLDAKTLEDVLSPRRELLRLMHPVTERAR